MNQSIEEVRKDLNINTLSECVSTIIQSRIRHITDWRLDAIGCASSNFTMDGVYRIYGTEVISEKEIPWSLILKIIKPEHDMLHEIELLIRITNIQMQLGREANTL